MMILTAAMTIPLWGASYTLRPGSLGAVMQEAAETKPEKIVLTGEVYSSELRTLTHLPVSVSHLDLSQLTIKGDDACGDETIPPFALFATNIKTLVLPDNLQVIEEGAFAETSLESVVIPSGVTNIGPRAFYNCRDLKSANMSRCKVTVLPEECFSRCTALEELAAPPMLRELKDRALMKTALRSLSLPNVLKIGRFALAEMPVLSDLSFQQGMEVEEGAFFNSPHLPSKEYFTFAGPALGFAMSGRLASGNIIDDKVIREGAFAGAQLSTIIIGPSVEKIEPQAFRNVQGLERVDVTAKGEDVPVLSEDAFSGLDVSEIHLAVVVGKDQIWREAPGWKNFRIVTSSGVEGLEDSSPTIAVAGARGMIEVTSEISIEHIGVYSLTGMLLLERDDCGEALTAGPFSDKEVIVRVMAGKIVKVANIMIN